jgi:hypothetical protein
MGNKRNPSKKQVAAWVDETLSAKLDELVKLKQDEQGKHFPYHRSDAVKMVLEEHLDTYIAKLKGKPNEET